MKVAAAAFVAVLSGGGVLLCWLLLAQGTLSRPAALTAAVGLLVLTVGATVVGVREMDERGWWD